MKKLLFFALALPIFASAQTGLYLQEDFETITSLEDAGWTMHNDTNVPFGTYQQTFPNAWAMVNWTAENGNTVASTPSWFTTLTPADRWLIAPSFFIEENVETTTLYFKARSHDNPPFQDGLTVKISETGTDKADFVDIFAIEVATNEPMTAQQYYYVDISEYRGKTVHIAFVNTNLNGNLLSIDDVTVQWAGTLAVDEANAAKNKITVYPNPVSESFKINFGSNLSRKDAKVTVTDFSGKKVKTFIAQEEYNIADLPKGAYIITVSDGKTTASQKLLKK